MPNNYTPSSVYITTNPELQNDVSLYAPGDLGKRFTVIVPLSAAPGASPIGQSGAAKRYQIVQTDSGMAIAPTRTLAAWWKNKNRYIVTTDMNAINRNEIAGVFNCNVTPGNYCCVQIGGPATVAVTAAPTAAVAQGATCIPSAADQGRTDCIAAGTAPTYRAYGIFAGPALAGNVALVDLAVPETN